MKKGENIAYLPDGWSLSSIDDLIGAEGLFMDGDWIESKDQDPNGSVRLIQLADIGEVDFKDKSKINELQTGTTRKRISRRNLATVKVPIAPLPGQLRIVDKIEELFSEIKKCEDQLSVSINQLTVYKQSLLTWTFEGTGNKNRKKAAKKWTSLGEIAEIVGGVTFPELNNKPFLTINESSALLNVTQVLTDLRNRGKEFSIFVLLI